MAILENIIKSRTLGKYAIIFLRILAKRSDNMVDDELVNFVEEYLIEIKDK
jgi:hypothetical protein